MVDTNKQFRLKPATRAIVKASASKMVHNTPCGAQVARAHLVMPEIIPVTVREKMAGKPILYRDAKTVLTLKSDEFQHKLLCDGITLNLGDACAFSCAYCYVGPAMRKLLHGHIDGYNEEHGTALRHEDFVIRRRHSPDLLRSQLFGKDGTARFADPDDDRVVYSSTLVDVAGNMELLRETADACRVILESTSWQIRLLSKSNLLYKLIADRMIPEKYHHRIIFGFSTGTLDDPVARAIEQGTALVSKRLYALHWLQDRGLRTFGMICPSLPQEDYDQFSQEMCAAIRAEKCEHVWAEVINVRGESFPRTLAALHVSGLNDEALRLSSVSGPKGKQQWEEYARQTFLAHSAHIPPDKLRFLQYVDKRSSGWWDEQRAKGAVLLGSTAKALGLTAKLPRTTPIVQPSYGGTCSR
jgi:DNA repair photolyase